MEGFNDLLHKLREVHDREVGTLQLKVQELSNKKGCDTKRMEELFNRNQQMKEQQRLLTENIKTLENRLRAGLCDRCTVTQEVAKRRQQEFEATHMQSLQHISLLAGEMNNLTKENKRLRDEIRTLKAALESHSEHTSNSSNATTTTTEVKLNTFLDLSSPPVPLALVATPASKTSTQPADGDVAATAEVEQKTEDIERRQMRGNNRTQFDVYKPIPLTALTLPAWKTEHNVTRSGEKRAHSVEEHIQHSSIDVPAPALLRTSTGGEMRRRHVLHTPVPCHPRPLKSSPISLNWPLTESSDWVTATTTGTSPAVQTSPKVTMPLIQNLLSNNQQVSSRRQVFGPPFQKQSTPLAPAKEPTVVFRFNQLTEYLENQNKAPEKKENPPSKAENVSEEMLKDSSECPLDLSDRGKSKFRESPLQGGTRTQRSPDLDVNTNPAHMVDTPPSLLILPSLSCSTPVRQPEEQEPATDPNHKVTKEQEQEELNGKTDHNKEKKVPVLTLSLRPVVVLESLNPALQRQDSLSSNSKSSSPTDGPESSSEEREEQESESGQENSRGCKRKRASVETATDRDSDTGNIPQERKIKIRLRTEEKSL
ncbi:uncharacterized protein rbbp8l isoform 2-T2 [Pholidichthys leucotaenia]